MASIRSAFCCSFSQREIEFSRLATPSLKADTFLSVFAWKLAASAASSSMATVVKPVIASESCSNILRVWRAAEAASLICRTLALSVPSSFTDSANGIAPAITEPMNARSKRIRGSPSGATSLLLCVMALASTARTAYLRALYLTTSPVIG